MFLLKKIKANSLQMVLVVSVIIILLLFAFISLIYIQKKTSIKNSNFKESVYLTHQVFDYIKKNDLPFGSNKSINFFEKENQQVISLKKQWGLFELLTITSKIKNESFSKTALIGYKNKKREALYLSNNNQQLILVGNTLINGNATIPSRGVNSGNIAGVSYNKQQYIFGKTSLSETSLPVILNTKKIQEFLSTYNNNSIEYFDLENETIVKNSFKQNTKVFQKNGMIEIYNSNLQGNIIIESDTLIKVHAKSTLKNIILIAPKIEIKEGFNGNLQAFASESISIKENCKLNYPTSLILTDNNEKGKITISKFSTIKGAIVYLKNNEKRTNFNQNIFIENTSNVYGEIYSEGNVELRGKVLGSIFTNSFIVNYNGGTYMNHIYNGIIDSQNLTEHYAGLKMKGTSKSVMKWLE